MSGNTVSTVGNNTTIGLGAGTTATVASILSAIQTAGGTGVTATLNSSGNIQISTGTTTDVAVTSGAVATALGISSVNRGGNVLSTPSITGSTVLSGSATAGGAEVLSSGFSAGPPR